MGTQYLETKKEVAEYLKLDYSEFLRMENDGRFPVRSKPKDPTRVYFLDDLNKWNEGGRQVNINNDPARRL